MLTSRRGGPSESKTGRKCSLSTSLDVVELSGPPPAREAGGGVGPPQCHGATCERRLAQAGKPQRGVEEGHGSLG